MGVGRCGRMWICVDRLRLMLVGVGWIWWVQVGSWMRHLRGLCRMQWGLGGRM